MARFLRPVERALGDNRAVFALLVVLIGLISLLQLHTGVKSPSASYSALTPMVAAALLPLRQTLIIGGIATAAAACVYGFGLPGVTADIVAVVTATVALACAISVVVCKARLRQEDRVRRLMIARDRLTLLTTAGERIGSTLDVARTARELAEVAVPAFADLVTVDLFDAVLRGDEIPASSPTGRVELRRVARRPVPAGRSGEDVPVMLLARYLAATEQPVRARYLDADEVDDWLDPTDVHGARSAIAVPLSARGVVLGVAMFLRHERPEPFDSDDLTFAAEIGARAAACLDNARRYARERETALALQQSLLPGHLPDLTAVEVASRYIPAGSGVGGDWFDVIPLSGTRVALVVGDVVGHGLHATATMARLRSAVRTLADIDLPPDELLTHLDDVVIRLQAEDDGELGSQGRRRVLGADITAGEMGATCLYAVYEPVSGHCTLASAGHPPPVVVDPDHHVSAVDLATGPPLGLGNLPFEAVELDLPQGSVLALYTDGLIESDRRDPDSGLRDLMKALDTSEPSLDRRCQAVLDALLDGQPGDDVALLMARTRRLDADHVATWDVPADPAEVADVRERVERQLTAWGLTDAVFTTELVVSELVTNAIRHATPPVRLRLVHDRHSLICEVSDASSTSPHLKRARTFDEGGRGLFIVAQLTQNWGTRHSRDGKTIWAEQNTEQGSL